MITIHVTAAHIADGIREHADGCAIALAVRDAYPEATSVQVGSVEVTIGHRPGLLIDIPLPAEAEKFIRAFDAGAPVEPFTFDLDCTGAAT